MTTTAPASANPPAHRFEVIDLYRGFGAICIVIAHAPELLGGQFLPQAYLALDVFFVMSGFVIANGFDQAITRGMSFQRFFLLRLIRFYPAYLFALLVTTPLLVVWWQVSQKAYSGGNLLGSFAASLFMLPSPLDPDGKGRLYALNGVCWSLFFEVVVNVFYFLLFPWLRRNVLLLILASSALLSIVVRLYSGTLDMGFYVDNAILVLPKLTFAFFAGVFLRRHAFGLIRHSPGPGTAAISLLAMIILFQHSRFTQGVATAAVDFIAVFLVFPAIVLFSSGISSKPWLAACGQWSGRFSYPMYVLQDAGFFVVAAAFKLLLGLRVASIAPWGLAPLLVLLLIVSLATDKWLEPWGAKRMRSYLLPAKNK